MAKGGDKVRDIEKAELIGDSRDNVLDASGFSGDVTLEGGDGKDTLYSGSGGDLLIGGSSIDQYRNVDSKDRIYAHTTSGYPITGTIAAKWAELGGESPSNNPVGMPSGPQFRTADGGVAQHFYAGGIYQRSNGDVIVIGEDAIWHRYHQPDVGGEGGKLGLPTSNGVDFGGGWWGHRFQGGVILSKGTTVKVVAISDFTTYFDPAKNQFGFRIGTSLLKDILATMLPSQITVKDTKYSKVYFHHFHLQSIDDRGINIGFSMRAEWYEAIPLTNRTWKRAETNVDVSARFRFLVASNGTIRLAQPLITDLDVSASGIGIAEAMEYATQVVTFIATKGSSRSGVFDSMGDLAAVMYNLSSRNRSTEVADPSSKQAAINAQLAFIGNLLGLGVAPGVSLKEIRYDANGVYIVFNHTEALEPLLSMLLPVNSFPA